MTYINTKRQTPEVLALALSLYVYDRETGRLLWVAESKRHRAGDPADQLNSSGYFDIRIGKETFLSHRVIWAMVHGRWPEDQIDHRDLNRANNRLENLREANLSQQQANTPPRKPGRLRGCTWHRQMGKWQAQIKIQGRGRYLGLFDTEAEAHAAWAAAAKRAFGDFVRMD